MKNKDHEPMGVQERLEQAGLRELWRRRAEGLKERGLLKRQLAELKDEISLFERWFFFRDTESEVAERLATSRLRDLEREAAETSARMAAFWDEESRLRPELARARATEDALALCLSARGASGIRGALEACRALLEPALEQARQEEPPQSYLVPLSALIALLEMAVPMRESSWGGVRETISFRPVLIVLVDRVMSAFRAAGPANLFPIDIVSDWLGDDNPELPLLPASLQEVYPPGGSRRELAELVSLFERLAGHDLALRLNRRDISFFDRVVFWSDTPAETREKELLAERAMLQDEIDSGWLDLERRLRGRRRESWEIYSADQALVVRDAVRAMATADGDSSSPKDCPLVNQEKAIWQVQAFANEISQRFGPLWRREALLEQALGGDAPAEDEASLPSLPAVLGPKLQERGFAERYRLLHEALTRVETEKEGLRESRAQISTWDRVNVFKESDAEAREKAMTMALVESQQQVATLRQRVEKELEDLLLEIDQPALVGMLLEELTIAIDQVRAECASRTRSYEDSQSDTRYETMYYCTLRGIEDAHGLLARLLASAAPSSASYLPLFEAAERWALLDSERAVALHALSLGA